MNVHTGKTFCIITDGEWDLKIALLQEAMKKGIKLAPHYSQFFDLKKEFRKQFPHCRRAGI
jgi:inhibitor of KinA sporulation pathway (predicted exonuclease)